MLEAIFDLSEKIGRQAAHIQSDHTSYSLLRKYNYF